MSPYRTVDVTKLIPGDTLGEPVFSEGLTKLLGSGCTVNEELISRLAERGVTEVVVKIPVIRTETHHRRNTAGTSSPKADVDLTRIVEHSCQCGSVIAIHPPAAGLPVAAWICTNCGAVYFGGVSGNKTRGVALWENESSAVAGTSQADTSVQSEMQTGEPAQSAAQVGLAGKDRRQQTRYSIGVPVVAVPLRADFSIAGPAVQMTTRDISKSGIALAYARFSDAPFYVIDFSAAGIELLQVLMKVLRVRHNGPAYEVAGEFINRLHYAG